MTDLLAARPREIVTGTVSRGWRWIGLHGRTAAILGPVLLAVGAATAWNLQGWPGRVNDDEGTYVAEAWAMIYTHHLSHYTYWYDHPPLGWAQLAAYAWLTGGFGRDASAVMVGREFMWLVTVASSACLYVLCRRLGFRRGFAGGAVLLFGLSPLAIWFHRMVSLDNIGTMWLLAALMFAASRRHSMRAAFWSAICLAAAVLSKETIAMLAPAVLWLIWQHTDRRTRSWNLGVFCVSFGLPLLGYPLLATLRGELLPGRGHVSLAWALWWQLFGRAGSGSPLDPRSGSAALVRFWLGIDPWLLAAGVALLPVALAVRRLRPLACGLLLQLLVPFKGGYLPYFYVTAMLPFAALLAAGTADTLWPAAAGGRPGRWLSRWPGRWPSRWPSRWLGRTAVLAAVAAFALLAGPRWASALHRQAAVHGATASLAATAWVERYVPRTAVVVTDDYLWPDLKIAGDNPLWMWKVDGDPQVARQELPQGWKSVKYIVMTSEAGTMLSQLPTLRAAMAHSVLVASFGQGVTIRAVLGDGALPPAITPPAAAWVPGMQDFAGPAPHGGILACFLPGPWDRPAAGRAPGGAAHRRES